MIRTWLSSAINLIVTAVVLLIASAVFVVGITTRSHPSASIERVGVADSVEVWRNPTGIPHIVAKNDLDAIRVQAWCHASDRLWQMEFIRRAAKGRLSEILGADAVRSDMFMRAVDLPSVARKHVTQLHPTSRAILDAYSSGVNDFLRVNASRLPFEFDALSIAPEPWTPEDCLLVGKIVALQFSVGFWTDIAISQIATQRGEAIVSDYIPTGSLSEPTVLDSVLPMNPQIVPSSDSSIARAPAAMLHSIATSLRGMGALLGISPSGRGSNAWAMALGPNGSIVANDPHLALGLPSTWYPVHITSPSYNVTGMSIPGLPLVISGRNDKVAWAVSSMMADDVDYFVERVDSVNSNYYIGHDGGREKFRYRRDTIHIRDQVDTIFDIRFTRRSAVISDVHAWRTPNAMTPTKRQTTRLFIDTMCITFRWTAQTTASDEILALHLLSQAQSLSDVQRATTTWHVPAVNLTVGSVTGEVATFPVGVVPVRSDGVGRADNLRQGWASNTDWNGYTSLSVYGSTGPRRRWVVAANNRLTNRAGPYVGSMYEPSSRAERISEQLSIHDDYTARDAQVMQMDVVSPYAAKFTARILPILRGGLRRYGSVETSALRILARWNGACSELEPGAAIFAAFHQRLMMNTFQDELGQALYEEYCFVTSLPTRRIFELIEQPGHRLFDDIRTPQQEDLSWIAIRSFIEAIQELRNITGIEDPEQWDWGMIHTVTLRHAFSANPLMRQTLDHGPFPVGGMGTTVLNTEWNINAPYEVRIGASMRMVNDMTDSVQYSVLPGGVSGQPLDANYGNQVQLWLKGGYVRYTTGRSVDPTFRLFSLLLPE